MAHPNDCAEDIGNESGKILLVRKWSPMEFWKISPRRRTFDAGIRLRVKHNNGVSDLFKQGKAAQDKGKNAGGGSFVATFQQDSGSVEGLLKMIEKKGNLTTVPSVADEE